MTAPLDKADLKKYREEALNQIWRGKNEAKTQEYLVSLGLSPEQAAFVVADATKKTKQGYRLADRADAIVFMILGAVMVFIAFAIGFGLFEVMGLRIMRATNQCVLGAIGTAGVALFLRGSKLLRDHIRGSIQY
jgi:hypothetical protein